MSFILYTRLSIVLKIVLFFVFFSASISAQQKLSPNVYLVKFTDKKFNTFLPEKPSEFLSERALVRRAKQNIVIKENDLPVSTFYIDSLKKLGFDIIHCSKWLNASAIYITDTLKLQVLKNLSFVAPTFKSVHMVYRNRLPDKFLENNEPYSYGSDSTEYGPSYRQIAMHNGQYLHSLGFNGKGVVIAVLDAGFYDIKDYTSLHDLWFENRVLLTRDFVDKTGASFYSHSHGSHVVSIMAGNSPGNLIGTAPGANYILLRTEDAASEYPIEEFNWVVAAELADSIGADIVQSSLGYSTFDGSEFDYTYNQMDGKHAISSIGATIAASKGMVVVCSAGNEGSNSWTYITAPADADSILAVGAIDDDGARAYFSSFGPTADKRIKPDVVAKGYFTYIQFSSNSFSPGNGTSYAAPVISGLTACLWQALPDLNNMQLIQAIKKYASLADNPDTIRGYGIPDFKKTLIYFNPEYYPYKGILHVYPNPFINYLNIEFEQVKSNISVLTITTLAGSVVLKSEISANTNSANEFHLTQLDYLPKGVYIIEISSGSKNYKTKIIKI